MPRTKIGILILTPTLVLSSCQAIEGQTGQDRLANYQKPPGDHGETIFFDPFAGHWRDDVGVCRTCTPENGFTMKGTVEDTNRSSTPHRSGITWVGVRYCLLNDLNAPPPAQEVAELFQTFYADELGHYPVHVREEDGIFDIIVPRNSNRVTHDFTDPRGALAASYTVKAV